MKRIFYLLIIPILFVSFESCRGEEVLIQSKWINSTISVDSNLQDWNKFLMTYFAKAGVSLGAVNDSEYFYIMLSFRDQSSDRFLQSKVTLWLDKTASKEKLLGLCYTGSPPARRQEDSFPELEENFTLRPAEMPKIITVLEHKEILGDTISVGTELGGFNPGKFRGIRPKSGEGPISGGIPQESGMPPSIGAGPGNRAQMTGKQEIWMRLSLAQSSQPSAEKSEENK